MNKGNDAITVVNKTVAVQPTAPEKVQSRQQANSAKAEKLLLEAHPSWWNFFWYLFFSWLIIPLVIALWKRAGLKLYVYQDRVVLERGVLSKHISQIMISDIRSVEAKYSLWQRMFRLGDILIGTAGVAGYEIVAQGLPNPRGIADLILKQRRGLSKTTD